MQRTRSADRSGVLARGGAASLGGASGAGGTVLGPISTSRRIGRCMRENINVSRAAEARHATSRDSMGSHQGFAAARRQATVVMANKALRAASRGRAVQPPPLSPGSEQRKRLIAAGLPLYLVRPIKQPMSDHPGTESGKFS